MKIIYLKGGGQKSTHNYSETCTDISLLSRFVLHVHTAFGDYLSPLTATPDGTSRQVPSFLYLKQQNLLTALDSLRLTPEADVKFSTRHAVDVLEPSVELREKLRQLEHFKMNLIETATAVLKEASSKPKRVIGDITGEASDLPTAKRQAR